MSDSGAPTTATTSSSSVSAADDSVASMASSSTSIRPPATAAANATAAVQLPEALHRSSLGSSTSGLVLYDLTNVPKDDAQRRDQKAFSPHCTKTILGLRLLGIGYERQRLTFTQVRGQLSERVADNVTVPTLELADGTHLSDSWEIAEFLASAHPRGSLLFPTPSSRPLASLLNTLTKVQLAPLLGSLCRPGVHDMLDSASQVYFAEDKVGKAKLDRHRHMTAEEREHVALQARTVLECVETALEHNTTQVPSVADVAAAAPPLPSAATSVAWIEGQAHPTHADFVVFGWYVYTLTCGSSHLVREIWHALPRLSRWVGAMREWCGDEVASFVA